MRRTLLAILPLLLSACSSTPILQTEGVNKELTPKQVVESGATMAGTRVVWGGVIVNTTNLKEQSRLEVLAYPLDSNLRPQSGKPAGNRFLAYHQGYLESVDYAAGRQVSMVGTLRQSEEGRLGEHSYSYPTLEVEQLHLWPVEQPQSEPKVRFGIGVMFHN